MSNLINLLGDLLTGLPPAQWYVAAVAEADGSGSGDGGGGSGGGGSGGTSTGPTFTTTGSSITASGENILSKDFYQQDPNSKQLATPIFQVGSTQYWPLRLSTQIDSSATGPLTLEAVQPVLIKFPQQPGGSIIYPVSDNDNCQKASFLNIHYGKTFTQNGNTWTCESDLTVNNTTVVQFDDLVASTTVSNWITPTSGNVAGKAVAFSDDGRYVFAAAAVAGNSAQYGALAMYNVWNSTIDTAVASTYQTSSINDIDGNPIDPQTSDDGFGTSIAVCSSSIIEDPSNDGQVGFQNQYFNSGYGIGYQVFAGHPQANTNRGYVDIYSAWESQKQDVNYNFIGVAGGLYRRLGGIVPPDVQDGVNQPLFGTSVAVAKNTFSVAVGAPGYNINAGAVLVYAIDTTYDMPQNTVSNAGYSTTPVIISATGSINNLGKIVLINDTGDVMCVCGGAVGMTPYIYKLTGSTWALLGQLANTLVPAIAMDGTGTVVVVGDNNGVLTVYDLSGLIKSNQAQDPTGTIATVAGSITITTSDSNYAMCLSRTGDLVAYVNTSGLQLYKLNFQNGASQAVLPSFYQPVYNCNGDAPAFTIAMDPYATSIAIGVTNAVVNGTQSGTVLIVAPPAFRPQYGPDITNIQTNYDPSNAAFDVQWTSSSNTGVYNILSMYDLTTLFAQNLTTTSTVVGLSALNIVPPQTQYTCGLLATDDSGTNMLTMPTFQVTIPQAGALLSDLAIATDPNNSNNYLLTWTPTSALKYIIAACINTDNTPNTYQFLTALGSGASSYSFPTTVLPKFANANQTTLTRVYVYPYDTTGFSVNGIDIPIGGDQLTVINLNAGNWDAGTGDSNSNYGAALTWDLNIEDSSATYTVAYTDWNLGGTYVTLATGITSKSYNVGNYEFGAPNPGNNYTIAVSVTSNGSTSGYTTIDWEVDQNYSGQVQNPVVSWSSDITQVTISWTGTGNTNDRYTISQGYTQWGNTTYTSTVVVPAGQYSYTFTVATDVDPSTTFAVIATYGAQALGGLVTVPLSQTPSHLPVNVNVTFDTSTQQFTATWDAYDGGDTTQSYSLSFIDNDISDQIGLPYVTTKTATWNFTDMYTPPVPGLAYYLWFTVFWNNFNNSDSDQTQDHTFYTPTDNNGLLLNGTLTNNNDGTHTVSWQDDSAENVKKYYIYLGSDGPNHSQGPVLDYGGPYGSTDPGTTSFVIKDSDLHAHDNNNYVDPISVIQVYACSDVGFRPHISIPVTY